jgi:hypothetical protein
MKLFKSLLVAPATLGLLAPMSATANEFNLAEVSGYSSSEEVQNISQFNSKELAVTNSRVDGLEARINNFEAGSFSQTTTATFSADFAVGSVDGGTATNDDAVMTGYGFQIDLNTSFTGEDSLDISIDAGNASTAGVVEYDLNDNGDGLTVDGISYTFPVGGATVLVGDSVDVSSLFNQACVYGGPSNTLDDCGTPNSTVLESADAYNSDAGDGSTTLAASYDFDNGWTASFGYNGSGGASTNGLMTREGSDAYALNASYTGDAYGVSLTYANIEDNNGQDDSFTGINAYWTPDGFPSISVGYEIGDDASVPSTSDELTSYFVGLQWDEVGPGKLGVAIGTKTPTVESNDELLMYEAFYSYPINDGMTLTPLLFVKEFATGTDDETGVMVKTSFSF